MHYCSGDPYYGCYLSTDITSTTSSYCHSVTWTSVQYCRNLCNASYAYVLVANPNSPFCCECLSSLRQLPSSVTNVSMSKCPTDGAHQCDDGNYCGPAPQGSGTYMIAYSTSVNGMWSRTALKQTFFEGPQVKEVPTTCYCNTDFDYIRIRYYPYIRKYSVTYV